MAKKQRTRYAPNSGTYALTGNVANSAQTAQALTGTYTLTGNAAQLGKVNKTSFIVDTGVYSLTGNTANFSNTNQSLTGTYTLTGSDTTLINTVGNQVDATAGVYTLTGVDAVLTGPAANATILSPTTGSYSLSMQGVTLTVTANPQTCHGAFQVGAFQFNAFQECLSVAPPIPPPFGLGGRIDGPEFQNPAKWRAFYEQQAIHNAAVRMGTRGALARWGGPTLQQSGRWAPLKVDGYGQRRSPPR